MNGQRLDTVTGFKYLGSAITDEGSKPEILSRITVSDLRALRVAVTDFQRLSSL